MCYQKDRLSRHPEIAERRKITAAKYYQNHKEEATANKNEWLAAHPDFWTHYNRERKYGLDKETFEALLEIQEFACALCGRIFGEKHPPCVDHCHATNKVRGLLCHNCNRMLSWFEWGTAWVLHVFDYLGIPPILFLGDKNAD